MACQKLFVQSLKEEVWIGKIRMICLCAFRGASEYLLGKADEKG